jgi:hypothetical protein
VVGRNVNVFDSTAAAIETDTGLTDMAKCARWVAIAAWWGYGRACRTGAAFDRRDAPTQRLNRHMESALKGHPYVKCDRLACWDLLWPPGQPSGVAGRPVRR